MFRLKTLILALFLAASALALAQGGTLIVALERDLGSTDPTVGGTIDAVNYNMSIADHLVVMGDSGLEPWVLTSWEATPEGVYTWKIREGITFHDGTTLDAEAVKFNVERLLVPENNLRYGSYFSRLQSIEVVDDYTLTLDTGTYDVEFMERMINIAIVSPTAVQEMGEAFRENPVGSGPFMFESYTPGERIVLTRNPNYWREGEPHVDSIVFRIIPESAVRLIELETGNVHYAVNMAGADLEAAQNAGLIIVAGPALGRLIVYFNLENITDADIRRAVNHAIDRAAIIDIVTGGLAKQAYYAVPEASWAHNPNLPRYEHDVERANRILDEAGWVRGSGGVRAKDGVRLEWDMPAASIPSRLRAAEMVAAMVSEIGIRANIRSMDSSAFTSEARGGNHDLIWMQWAGSSSDPWNFALDLHCDYAWNMAQACEPKVLDPLIESGKETVVQDTRQSIYDAYFTYVQDQSLYVAVGHLPPVFISSPEVEGVRIVGGRLLFNEARLTNP